MKPHNLKRMSRRLLLLCSVSALCACASALAASPPEKRDFWVWNLNVMPPGNRLAHAVLKSAGNRSLIYVEDALESQISPEYISRLGRTLEGEAPAGALMPSQGVIPFEENLFGPLPTRISTEDRLIILFADLGKYKEHEFDGFFNVYDQVTDAEAQKEGQRSNESNIIYINGLRRDETYTNSVISHELEHLLEFSPGKNEKDNWISETTAEGAMLLTGHFSDQLHVNKMMTNPGEFPLVSNSYVAYGPQLLFASFLIDFSPEREFNLRFLAESKLPGRTVVEQLFENRLGNPQTFDAIYSSFLSYIFAGSDDRASLPFAWARPAGTGVSIPPVTPYKVIGSFPASVDGWIYPYAFVLIELANELSPNAQVKVQSIADPTDPDAKTSCATTASVLWKPVGKKRIAVYSVGCEPNSKKDLVHFRLSIQDRP